MNCACDRWRHRQQRRRCHVELAAAAAEPFAAGAAAALIGRLCAVYDATRHCSAGWNAVERWRAEVSHAHRVELFCHIFIAVAPFVRIAGGPDNVDGRVVRLRRLPASILYRAADAALPIPRRPPARRANAVEPIALVGPAAPQRGGVQSAVEGNRGRREPRERVSAQALLPSSCFCESAAPSKELNVPARLQIGLR